MLNKKNRLDKKELTELRERYKLLNEYRVVCEALELQVKFYINKLLQAKGFDLNKNYNINLDNGNVEEKKVPSQSKPIEHAEK